MESSYNKFNAGVWSEALTGRVDLQNYRSAAKTCCNFIPSRYGSIDKRAGTKYLGTAKANTTTVLHPFQYSVNTKFLLEFGASYIRFWSNDAQVEVTPSAWVTSTAYILGDAVTESGTTYICVEAHTSGTFATDLAASKWYTLTGNILEVETPYLAAELHDVQIRAVNDVVYIVHPDHPVGKLTRLADDNWTYEVASLTQPFVDPDVNSSDVTLTPSATTGSITVTASADVFAANYVGSELRLEYLEEGTSTTFDDAWGVTPSTTNPDLYVANDDAVTYSTTAASGTYMVSNASGNTRVRYDTGVQYEMFTVIRDFTFSAWATSTSYAVDDLVQESSKEYICLEAHTSGTFATDLAANKWKEVTDPRDAPAYFSQGVVAMEPAEVTGEWSLKTTGNWTGSWVIQRSIDGGSNWSTIKTLVSRQDSNYLVEEDQDGEAAQIRVLLGAYNDGGLQNEPVVFSTVATPVYGRCTVTSYTSPTSVDATVNDEMPETNPSIKWQESGFSARQGYPRSISLFDNRLVMAGTAKKPQAFFYSGINEYDNFLGGTLADSPFFVETLSDDQSAVQWLIVQRELFVGTAATEGVLISRKSEEAQSPENLPVVRWQDSLGSAHRPALPVRDGLLILQRGQTTLNMMTYSIEKDGYTGEEVSLLCPHLFNSGILQMAHIREPYTGVFVVTQDGKICHMVYEPSLQVTGWCEYTTTGGTYKSVQVLPGSGDEDFVYAVVQRTINGVTSNFIEKFVTGNTQKQRDSDTENVWYLDCAVEATSGGGNVWTGLGHLEGEEVSVLADGSEEIHTVASGQITLTDTASTKVIVGIPITSEFEPLDINENYGGQNTFSKRGQLFQTKLLMWKSLGGQVASDGQDYQDIVYHAVGEGIEDALAWRDGWTEIFHESAHGRQKWWRLKHDQPYPFTLQAVNQSFKPNRK